MAITAAEAREQIATDLASAIDEVALAQACLGEAFERLAVTSADRLEAELFRPTQRAFGRSKRTYLRFAEQHGLATRGFDTSPPGPRSQGARDLIETALTAAGNADGLLAELQDSMLPIEFGDAELRSGIAEARASLGELAPASRTFLRGLGR